MKQMPSILLQLENYIKPFAVKTVARFSKRSVPHIVVYTDDNTYSIMYFKRTDRWRIFYPYPSNSQVKFDEPTFGQVEEYFQLGCPK